MANEQITSPILLDSTGVAIKDAIQQVANNVKPDATEINMGPNDSTKVSAAMASLSEQIAIKNLGTITTLSGFQSALDTMVNGITGVGTEVFNFTAYFSGVGFEPFNISNSQIFGTLTIAGENRYNVELNNHADISRQFWKGCKLNSTWTWFNIYNETSNKFGGGRVRLVSIATDNSTVGFKLDYPSGGSFTILYTDSAHRVASITKSTNQVPTNSDINSSFASTSFSSTTTYLRVGNYCRGTFLIDTASTLTITTYVS